MDAKQLNELGQKSLDANDLVQAIEHFEKAISLSSDWSVPHYNLGLCYKFKKMWAESLKANARAHKLDPDDDASYWNLAIAAVAESDWEQAGVAFRAIGLRCPEGPPPWDFDLGLIPIRVSPGEHPEVVWCHRLDPVRAQIANVPYPDCGRRFGDIVLNDAEPKGYRQLRGTEVPVFNELALLEQSLFHTFELRVVNHKPEGSEELEELFENSDPVLENWTKSVRMLCRACSEGRPHREHDQDLERESSEFIKWGVASRSETDISDILRSWRGGRVLSLDKVLL